MNATNGRAPDVSIVIISYNTWHYLEHCLHSIEQFITQKDFEIVVVDNKSIDGSVQKIRQNFEDIILIENERNEGFAAANNKAFAYATGAYVFLLNADTVLLDDGLGPAMDFMRDNNVAVLGPMLLNEDRSFQRSFSRHGSLRRYVFDIYILALGLGRFRRLLGARVAIPDQPTTDVGFLVGAAMLIRREAISKYGLFDEQFFFTGEERDLCMRYKEHGELLAYYPDWKIVHYGGSGNPHSRFHIENWVRASQLLARKHGGWLDRALMKGALFLVLSLYWLRFSLRARLGYDRSTNRENGKVYKAILANFLGLGVSKEGTER